MISIITPVLDHTDLIADYAAATHGAHVVIVDTGSAPDARKQWQHVGHLIDYALSGHNYGHWCNAGFAHAVGDVIVFLNNDVRATGDWLAQVAEDVKDGAIYGPELLAQNVDGVLIPFLSGWCVAATKKTWERLVMAWNCEHRMGYGEEAYPYQVWDQDAYPAAGYWEDNDLSFRAMLADIRLEQTTWPITHLDGGNATSKARPAYYADVERNKATFARTVREAMRHAAV